ncbi:putative adipose-regulatory protein (Seipin) [Raphanus sativus]|uniref:Seipin-1-like n=1 Tax=Raphanus sativus TaxID=3726 RepID=A0A6J0M5L6_RAPSA|nr:seipin-1-like [Raphanus sativus]KAJ4912168.1 putative adipose-regulatory protein (Seipin) [Raphanus sativus]
MEELDTDLKIPDPLRADWFLTIVDIQADLIYNALVVLTSPLFLLYRSYRRATATISAAERVVKRAPSQIKGGAGRIVRRTWFGVMGACHVSAIMVVALILAGVIGVGIVSLYVEKPVVVREKLFFDYTEDNPSAVFSFDKKKRPFGVPLGHKVHVSLVLWMPESDLNRRIGLFQLKVELLSLKGEIIARSSQPCMLRFRSQPIRLARTFVMSVPLVTGIANEAQTMRIDALIHQEKWPRTRAVRTTLIPRAQTRLLPQLYEAEIVINSKPPWTKRMAYNWKWTLCVWTSMYLYVPILIALLWCFRPFLFPYVASRTVVESQNSETEVVEEEVGERRLRDGRNKPRRRTFTTTQETYI